MGRVDWRLLECFRVVGRLENVSRAARELGTSQPAVSRAISRFEAKLGAPLFRRVGRSVRLTAQGAEFLKAVERAYTEIEGAQVTLLGGPDDLRPIRVGFVRTLGVRLVPELVRRFQEEVAPADFAFVSNNGPALEELVLKGELEMIFTALPTRSAGLSSEKIADQELVLVAPQNSAFARKEFVDLAELRMQPFVMFKRGHVIRSLAEILCNAAGFSPHVSYESDDSSGIPGFVAAGLGVAFMPQDGNLPKEVVVLRTRAALMLRPMGLAWTDDNYMHPRARAFKSYVLAKASEQYELSLKAGGGGGPA